MDRSVWAAKLALRIGDYHVGVRLGSPDIAATLEPHIQGLVADDPLVPANYSLLEVPGQPISFRVYRGCSHIFTTPSVERAVAFVAGLLQSLLPLESCDDAHLVLYEIALVHEREAVVVPHRFLQSSPSLELRLAHHDVTLLERTRLLIDPSAKELVVPSARLGSEQKDFVAIMSAQTPPGRYRLKGWMIWNPQQQPLSLGRVTAEGMANSGHTLRSARSLAGLSHLASAVAIYGVANSRDVIETVTRIWPAGDVVHEA